VKGWRAFSQIPAVKFKKSDEEARYRALLNKAERYFMKKKEKIIIIGGDAAGMTAANKIRRNNELADISVFEKGEYISYAACGIPYYISNEIEDIDRLMIATPEKFIKEKNIQIHLQSEVISIHPREKAVNVKALTSSLTRKYTYDKLLIATGAVPKILPIEGVGLKNVFSVRSIYDALAIKSSIQSQRLKKAVIIGSGYVGLEMAEALRIAGLEVTVVELANHLLPSFDPEFSSFVENVLHANGCHFHSARQVFKILGKDKVEGVELKDGQSISADLVILSNGIKPNTELAKLAGIELGKNGAIKVNNRMQTNLRNIYAAGDCAEIFNLVKNKNDYIPLGTNANKQGKVAADNICQISSKLSGVTGTAIFKLFDREFAITGLTEKFALKLKIPAKSVLIKSHNRAGYYPNAGSFVIKLIFNATTGLILGTQMFGSNGSVKRIDVISTALSQKMTIEQLSRLDLAYAPPFSPVWDPILIAAQQALKMK
jgi:NADPH-dependent 2,4-dienoyl-CoA reductase/sulfur reductase-like enzyme